MNLKRIVGNTISWITVILVVVIGIVNIFIGKRDGFWVLIILLASVFFPPVNVMLKKTYRFFYSGIVKIILFLLILWTALGVGELFGKVHLMLLDF